MYLNFVRRVVIFMNQAKIGKFIAELRNNKNLTQEKLGEMLGIGGKSVSKWERGINLPDISLLSKLSEILEVDVTELLAGERKIKNEDTQGQSESSTSTTENKDVSDKEEKSVESINARAVEGIKLYNKKAKKKYIKITLVIITIIVIAFTSLFMINNYNKFKVYKVSSGNEEFMLTGYVMLNQERNLMIFNDITYINKYVGTNKKILVKMIDIYLKCGDTIVYRNDDNIHNWKEPISLDKALTDLTITIDEIKKDNEYIINEKDIPELFLVIRYKNEKNEEKDLNIKLNVVETYSNNKLFY